MPDIAVTISTLNDLQLFAKGLISHLGGAHIIALSGDLGAGKTALTQCIAKELGITDAVTSPTFVLMNLYETASPTFSHMAHVDAYRLKNQDELLGIGISDYLNDPQTLVIIEWADKVKELLAKYGEQVMWMDIAREGDARRVTIFNEQESMQTI